MEAGTDCEDEVDDITEACTDCEEEEVLLISEGAGTQEGFFLAGTLIRGRLFSLPASSMIDLIRFVEDFSEAFLFVPGFFPLLFGIPTSDIFVMFTPLCFFARLFSSESRQYFCSATATVWAHTLHE